MPLWNRFAPIALLVSGVLLSNAEIPSPADVLNQTGASFPPTWGTNNGKPIDATVRVTQVWAKTKDGWKMASLQATNIASESTSAKPDVKKDEANKPAANK